MSAQTPLQTGHVAVTLPPRAVRTARPSAAAIELGVISALCKRDLLRLVRERSRWLGVVLQPLLFWAILGAGLGHIDSGTTATATGGAAQTDYLAFSFPGILVMVVLFTTIFSTMSVIEDRQQGFLQQVLTGPGSRASMVFGKTLGVTTVSLVQAALCLLAAPLAGYALGSIAWLPLISALCLGAFMLTGLGFALAWVVGSTHGYHAIMAVVLLPLWLISGALFPARDGWLGWLMAADPMSYMVDAVRHALAGGVALGTGSGPIVSMSVLALLAVGALALATASTRVRGGRP